MPSAVWKGSVSFGLVSIPVALHTATSDRSIRFHQLERGTADRIRNKRVNERTGGEVDYADIVKGYELGGGEYVVLSPQELEAAVPERSRSIEISAFVDLAEIDPLFYETPYYLAPDGEGALKAYALLRQAMHQADKVAVATMVLRNKEHLVTVRARQDVLVLETMHFVDEIRRPEQQIPVLADLEDQEFTEAERSTAGLLLESMTKPWVPEDYHDTYRERVESMVEAKRQGQTVLREGPPPPAPPVIDLVQALQASIERAEKGARRSPARPKARSGSPKSTRTPGASRGAAQRSGTKARGAAKTSRAKQGAKRRTSSQGGASRRKAS